MSQATIGSLRVNLGLDSAQFSKGASAAQKSMRAMRTQFLAVAGAAAAMGAALSAAALKGAKDIDEAAKASRRLGTSIGGFRAAQLAAGEMGVSVSTLTDNLQTMNREIERGSVGAKRSLDALGISAGQLAGLDADQKLALIADQVQSLGLNADQASVLLQDLGIRNREMVLAVLSGGDAFRKARSDIDDYGLALSSVDASTIEKANDQLGRLGLISQYAGQQLALALVPAMGKLAEAMTDSLREGGLLRTVIDGLVNNLDRLATYVAVAVAAFGIRYVGALAAASFATMSLTGALALLRAALIRTGIGAVIVGVGELVLWFGRLVERVGGVGNAFKLLAAQGKAAALELKSNFLESITAISVAFIGMTQDFATGMNAIFKTNIQGLDFGMLGNASLSGELTGIAGAARKAYTAARIAREEAGALAVSLSVVSDEAGDTSDSIAAMNDALDETAGGGSGGAKAAKVEVDNLATTLSGPLTSAVDGVANAFADFMLRGFRDFKSFARGILDSFKQMLAQMIATAARNKIMFSMGMGGSTAGSIASAAGSAMGGAAGVGSTVGAVGIGSAVMHGASLAASGFMSGGFAGMTTAIGAQVGAATAAGASLASMAAAASAVALPVLAVVAAIDFLRVKTKTLDTGLRVTVGNMDTLVESFKKVEKSKFWGLSKSTSTRFKEVVDSPIAAAINDMQGSILDAARVLGVGGSAFDDFSYKFKLSLKGLSQDQQMAKINEELGRMGDSFAMLAPGVENMNSLLQQAAQISAEIRSLMGFAGFATLQDQIFAVSQQGNLTPMRPPVELDAPTTRRDEKETQGLIGRLIDVTREGILNQARLSSKLVALQERAELAPT